MKYLYKIWHFILSVFRITACIVVLDRDYWTGEKVRIYICSGKKWKCKYYIWSLVEDGEKRECLRAYNSASDDYIRCGDDDAVRAAVVEGDKNERKST